MKMRTIAAVLAIIGSSMPLRAGADPDPCTPTDQPDGILVGVGPTCDPDWYPGQAYYVQAEPYYDPDPYLNPGYDGPADNPRGCKSAVVLRLQVTSNQGVPMTADGSVKCEGMDVWGMRGSLDVRRANGTILSQNNWGPVGYHGLPPTGSSSTYDSSSTPGHTVSYNCKYTSYYGYRAKITYYVLRSAVDNVGQGPYYAATNIFKGKCKG